MNTILKPKLSICEFIHSVGKMYNFLLLFFNSSILLIFLNVLLLIFWDHKNKKRFLAQLSTDIVVAPYLPIIGSTFLIDGKFL